MMEMLDTALAFWCLPVIALDLIFHRVSWCWSLLGLLGMVVLRAASWVSGGVQIFSIGWIVFAAAASWKLWRAGVWGGADAKTAITLAVARPDPLSWLLVGTTVLVCALVAKAAEDKKPRHDELNCAGAEEQPKFPMAAALCLGGLISLLL